ADNNYSGGSTEALVFPWICAFTPAEGQPGSKVTITGSGFNQASSVAIGGSRASFTLESATKITMVVPRGAVSGPITVRAPNGTVTTSANFTIAAPHVR